VAAWALALAVELAVAEQEEQESRLAVLRQDYIVEDAEALRRALGIEKWALFGQSFGGFCITAYLSAYPESVTEAFLTGGLPTITDVHASAAPATASSACSVRASQAAVCPWAGWW